MQLVLTRKTFTEKSTIGELADENGFICYILEDMVRSDGEKVYGETAIPQGDYDLIIRWSPKLNKMALELVNVPNFTNVLIHMGNKPEDTEACLLTGVARGINFVYGSRDAYALLWGKVIDALTLAQRLTIKVQNA
jgi:hypothetical protein